MLKGKRIFITGGAGFLGRNLIERYHGENEITIYSRDEAKHYYLKKKYPKVNFVIGDVRNLDLMRRASAGHDTGIFAASLKQIEAVDQNVEESVDIIVRGAINSRRVAEENDFEAACFISSDKSRAATTLYGSMKFIAGESFIVNSESSNTRLSTAIYGNVINSTGSIIPLIWDAINNGYPLTLYSEEMTRFMIDIDDAMDVIEHSLLVSGYNIIPNLKSFRISDLFDIYHRKFGLKYTVGKPRISEKIHEVMISREEAARTYLDESKNIYMMSYRETYGEKFEWEEFTSEHTVVAIEELDEKLREKEYFKK